MSRKPIIIENLYGYYVSVFGYYYMGGGRFDTADAALARGRDIVMERGSLTASQRIAC